ncbi:MAG: alpha/beta hydrolase [Sphingomicrobium sp.]
MMAPDLDQPLAELRLRDGLTMRYRDYPGATAGRPPLLCLHGLTRNARDFADLAARHAPRFRVIAPDFRGRGASDFDPVPTRYNPLTYAGDVIQMLDQLAIPQAIFVGTSLGGLVTMAIAATAQKRIAGSILNDVGPELSQDGLDRIAAYVGKDVRFKSWDEAAAAIADNHDHIPTSFRRSDWLAMARRLCRERSGFVVYDYDMAIALLFASAGPTPRVDLWPLFKALAKTPLLIIRGERSDLLSEAAVERMKRAAPDASFTTVAGAPHPPTLNEPEAIAAVDAFLARF